MGVGLYVLCFILSLLIQDSEGGGCGAWTGTVSPTTTLSTEQELDTQTNLEVKLGSQYISSCSPCGIVTAWRFYSRRNGTVILYVLDGSTVKGFTSVHVPPLSLDNYFEIPLSSEMWLSVKNGYGLGYFTTSPMITYVTTSGYSSSQSTGQSQLAVGSAGTFGSTVTNRQYAVAAYIETAHSPMFTNAPVTITMYTHETSTVVHTFSVTDLDPGDTLTLACTNCDSYFTFDAAAKTLTYASKKSRGTHTYTVTVSDGCNTAVQGTATIILLNEKPKITSLPASTTVHEKATSAADLHTIVTSDSSGDTVSCQLDTVEPGSGVSKFAVSGFTLSHIANPAFAYTDAKYYNIKIKCTDGENNVYSNFQVDIIKNLQPTYTAGSGYLPASVSVDRTSGKTIYTLTATDTESDSFTFTKASCSKTTCPISVSSAGVVTTSGTLDEAGYDVTITVNDGTRSEDRVLSVLVSEGPLTFNDPPLFINLPATKNVVENTAVGTYLFQVMYVDKNPLQTFTLTKSATSQAAVDTYFAFDATTGKVSIKANIDYDTIGSGSDLTASTVTMTFTVSDGTDTGAGTLTLQVENVNESPTIVITTSALTINEGVTGGTFNNPGLSVTDPDITSGDTHTYSMDCGADSKYFKLTNNQRVRLAREYDMDSGLSGTATCTVTVTDAAGLSHSGSITLTVININDHIPKFPHHNYVFLVSSNAVFFTLVANLTASDYDSNAFGSTNGILTYSFDTASDGNFFQIDASGILYVRDVSSFDAGSFYVLRVVATDSGSSPGTCTVTIIFPGIETTTTTTTTRSYEFIEDHTNNAWLAVVGMAVFVFLVLIAFIIWKDPVTHNRIILMLFRIREFCREKPKEPNRTVGKFTKLTVTVNNTTFENNPDNDNDLDRDTATPLKLLAEDADEPELNEVKERLDRRQELHDRNYKDVSGLKMFENGKGAISGLRVFENSEEAISGPKVLENSKGTRPSSGRNDMHSSSSSNTSRSNSSAKYATFKPVSTFDNDAFTGTIDEDSSDVEYGSGLWENPGYKTTPVALTPARVEINDQDD